MDEQAREVFRCPRCGETVPDGTDFVLAQVGHEQDVFSESGEVEVSWEDVRRERFHPSHFREKIGTDHYRRVTDD